MGAQRVDPLIAADRRLGTRLTGLLLVAMLAILFWRHASLEDEALAELGRVAAVQRASLEWVMGRPAEAESSLLGTDAGPEAIREAASALLWQWRWPEGRAFLVDDKGEILAGTPTGETEITLPPTLPAPSPTFVSTERGHILVQPVDGTALRLVHAVTPPALRTIVWSRLSFDVVLCGIVLVGLGAAWLAYRRRLIWPAARLIDGMSNETAMLSGQDPELPAPFASIWAQARRRVHAATERDIRHELEESRLTAAIQGVSDGILIVDPAGRPVTFNDAFLQLLPPDAAGLVRRGESLKRSTSGTPQLGSSEAVLAIMGDRLAQPASVSGSFTLPLAQGGLELTELPTTAGCRIWIARNERKPLSSRPSADEHGPAIALMGRLARELADPLALLVSQTRRLRDEAADEPTRFRAERAQAAAERCAELVDTCRTIAGDRAPRFGMVMADELVDQVLEREKPAFEAAAIAVTRGFAPHPPPVWGDAEQLDTVVTSLLANARDALITQPEPRQLTVRMRRLEEQLLIDIEDNGPGIAPTMKGRLLEPFATTKGDRGGTGLGLAFCRGIMGLHHGSLVIEAGEEGGTKVTLGLPVRLGAAEPTSVTRLVLTPPTPGRARIPAVNGAAVGATGSRPSLRALPIESAAS